MTTLSVVTGAISDVRAKFIACASDITAQTDVEGRAIYSQAGLPYWTLRLERLERASTSSNIVQYNVTAQAVYHGWPYTGGQDGEFEEAAQLYLLWLPAEFDARPQFNSDAYPTGTGYLAPEGIVVGGARIAKLDTNDSAAQLAIVVDLVIPFELQIEEAH